MHYLVNAQKGLTILWCTVLLLFMRPKSSLLGFVYMGLHGGYGIVWLLKDYCVPDARFRQVISKMNAGSRKLIIPRSCNSASSLLVHTICNYSLIS